MAGPDFALISQTSTSIAALQGKVDGFPEEEHNLEVSLTGYPVESGATITDHAVKLPDKLTLTGYVSDLLPIEETPNPPNVRNAEAWRTIINLMERRERVSIVTPIRVYRNMIITKATAPISVQTGRSLRFTLELVELIQVDFQENQLTPNIVSGPAVGRESIVDEGLKDSPLVEVAQATSNVSSKIFEGEGFNLPSGLDTGLVSPISTRLPGFGGVIQGISEGSRTVAQQLPVGGNSRSVFQTVLSNQTFRILPTWNRTSGLWNLSMLHPSGRSLLTSKRLVERGVFEIRDLVRNPSPENFLSTGQNFASMFRRGKMIGRMFVDGVGNPGRNAWGNTHRILWK